MLVGVRKEDVGAASLAPYLERFCETGLFTPETIKEDIVLGTRQCWVIADPRVIFAVVLTQIGDDEMKTCRLTHWAGKDVRKWHHLICGLEAWAQEIGCRRFEIHAPTNGLRLAMKYGYEPSHVIMEKAL